MCHNLGSGRVEIYQLIYSTALEFRGAYSGMPQNTPFRCHGQPWGSVETQRPHLVPQPLTTAKLPPSLFAHSSISHRPIGKIFAARQLSLPNKTPLWCALSLFDYQSGRASPLADRTHGEYILVMNALNYDRRTRKRYVVDVQ